MAKLETMTNISKSYFRMYIILATSLSEHNLRIPEGWDAVLRLDWYDKSSLLEYEPRSQVHY